MSGLNIGFNLGKNIEFYFRVYSLSLTLGEDMKFIPGLNIGFNLG